MRVEFAAYLAQIENDSAGAPRLHEFSAAIAKVSRSYAPGLFYTYDVSGLPRTNNDRASEFRKRPAILILEIAMTKAPEYAKVGGYHSRRKRCPNPYR